MAWRNDSITNNPSSYSSVNGAIASDVVFMSDSTRFCFVFVDNLKLEFRCGSVTNFSSNWIPSLSIGLVNSTRIQLGLTRDQSRFGVLVDSTTARLLSVSASDGYVRTNPISSVSRIDQIITLNEVRSYDLLHSF